MKLHKKILLALALTVAAGSVMIGVQTHRAQQDKWEEIEGRFTSAYGPTSAFAQSNWSSNLNGDYAVGDMAGVFNVSADTLIRSGDLVEADTSTVIGPGRYRLGVRKLALTATSALRCAGIAVNDIPRRGTGKILTRGYHPGAFVSGSAVAGNAPIKISRTVPGSFIVGDTTSANVGWVVSRTSTSTSTGVRYKYKRWFWGSKVAGATL